ncbi:MAG TPA: NAD-dependent epimerase/dehydratase family protein [Holophagaceae bacterium]|nr:NAD-dependent epimerase/dehydratase family protein [Holophagaceae bacterium]
MRILVTGSAGFIATNLIPRLLAEGHEVLGLDNFFLGKRAYLAPFRGAAGFTFLERDLLELEGLVGVFESFKPDRVWHLAANSDISFGTKYTDFDLKGGTLVTYNVLEAMRRCGTPEIVFSSSGAIYGEPTVHPTPEHYGPISPISLYAASKLACEGLISAYSFNYDIRAWVFRFGNIVGPNPTHGVIHDFVIRLLKDPTRLDILGDGTQTKPYVDVDDCLDGMMFGQAHARERFNCYNLAVEDGTSVTEIARCVLEAMGLNPERVELSYSGGSRGWKGDVPFVNLDTTRMKRLGWAPKLNSLQAVQRCAEATVRQFRGGVPE